MAIHKIYLNSFYSQHEIFQESVVLYLVTNRLPGAVTEVNAVLPQAVSERFVVTFFASEVLRFSALSVHWTW